MTYTDISLKPHHVPLLKHFADHAVGFTLVEIAILIHRNYAGSILTSMLQYLKGIVQSYIYGREPDDTNYTAHII